MSALGVTKRQTATQTPASAIPRRGLHLVAVLRRRLGKRSPHVAGEAPRDHHRESIAVPNEQCVDMAEQALRARAGREYTRMKVERTALREHGRGTGADDLPCDAACTYIEERATDGVQRIAFRVEIGKRRGAAREQEPRARAEPQRGQRVGLRDRVGRDGQGDAEELLRFVGERSALEVKLHVPRGSDRRFGKR